MHNGWKLLQDPIPQWLKAQHKNRQAGRQAVQLFSIVDKVLLAIVVVERQT